VALTIHDLASMRTDMVLTHGEHIRSTRHTSFSMKPYAFNIFFYIFEGFCGLNEPVNLIHVLVTFYLYN